MAKVLLACLLLAFLYQIVNGQQIAQQKCSQYEDEARVRATPVSLLPGLPPIKIDCSQTPNFLGWNQPQRGEFPHHALLGWPTPDNATGYEFRCGGSLISDRYVLTAAHCQLREKPTVVRLGEFSILTDHNDEVDVGIESIVVHPEFRARTAYNDIALVKLIESVTFSRLIRPACLWTEHNLNVTRVTVTGFELYGFHGTEDPDHMVKQNLDLLQASVCQDSLSNNRRLPSGVIESQVCLGSDDNRKDSCQGDSGSAAQILTTRDSCTHHIVGVASVMMCSAPGMTSIYTRVASYIGWIEGIVWE